MKIIIYLVLFTSCLISAQTQMDSIVSKQIAVMGENKITEFFIIEKFCDGCVMHTKKEFRCSYRDSDYYVFWKEENVSYFNKISKCNTSKIKIADDVFNDYEVNRDKIKSENVKSYQINRTTFGGCDKTRYARYYFIIDEKLLEKFFDYYALTTQSEIPNINYDYNKSLEIVKLDALCQKIIRKNR